jgi:hypothetical protein
LGDPDAGTVTFVRISFVRVLLLASLGVGCREANPDWDPERQAATEGSSTTPGEASGSEDTSTLPECEDHEVPCGDQCVDLLSSVEHCGECFMECRPPDRSCEEGECVR